MSLILTSSSAKIIADHLHASIADLIDGNHVERSEVINAGSRSCSCKITYKVNWYFEPEAISQRLYGNCAVSQHYDYDQARFDAQTQSELEKGRTHKPIRTNFIAGICNQGGNGIALLNGKLQIWNFGQHSVFECCNNCSGHGEVTCYGCRGSGKNQCDSCNGTGHTRQTRWVQGNNGGYYETYNQPCYVCGLSGIVTCYQCRGNGRLRCESCIGYGFFTLLVTVIVNARPHTLISVFSDFLKQSLSNYLVRLPFKESAYYLDFFLDAHGDDGANSWQVTYVANTTIVELDVRLRGKIYKAAGMGEKVLAFIRPPIFDDIFAEEIADLMKMSVGKTKKFNNLQARKFFETYAGQPVLDKALKAVAVLQGAKRETPGDQIVLACNHYISTDSASMLGKSMQALLDKISPTSSGWSWAAVMTLPLLLVFLMAQNFFEFHNISSDHWQLAKRILLTVASAGALTVMLSPVAAILSTIISGIRRRALPPEYRQHGRNWEPLKLWFRASLAVALLGVGFGSLSNHNIIPRWNNAPLMIAVKWSELYRYLNYEQRIKFGFYIPDHKLQGEYFNVKAVILDVQRNFNMLGYKVVETGEIDAQTQSALKKYAKKKYTNTRLDVVLYLQCEDLKGKCSNAWGITSESLW